MVGHSGLWPLRAKFLSQAASCPVGKALVNDNLILAPVSAKHSSKCPKLIHLVITTIL